MSRCCCCCLRTSGRCRWCCWTGTSRGMSLALGVSGGVGGCGVGDGGSCLPCLRRNECGGFNECGFGTYYCCRVVLARRDRFTSKTTGLLGPYGFMEISVDGYDDPPNGRHRSGQKRWFAPGNPRAARLWLSSVYQVPKFVYE